uniref:Putative tumor protein d52 family n=1 Tax=Rhipicephalus microplus TaxID=6941 RepID=A0A6G5AFM3_RHIMP
MSTTPREERKAFTMSGSENFFDASADVKATDATPDSGVHDLSGMDPEEKARQEAVLRDELAQVEEEIQSLRTVLATKVARSQELKRQLGISVWKELKDDMEQGIKNIQDTAAFKDVSGKLVEWNAAITSAPIYLEDQCYYQDSRGGRLPQLLEASVPASPRSWGG